MTTPANVYNFPKGRRAPMLADAAADAFALVPAGPNSDSGPITAMQQFLVATKYIEPLTSDGSPVVTGTWTARSGSWAVGVIKNLQKELGIEQTGLFNPDTIAAIRADVQRNQSSVLLRRAGLVGQPGGAQPSVQLAPPGAKVLPVPPDTSFENIAAWLTAVGVWKANPGASQAQNQATLSDAMRELARSWGFNVLAGGMPFAAPNGTYYGTFLTMLKQKAGAGGGASSYVPLIVGGLVLAGGLWYWMSKKSEPKTALAEDLGTDIGRPSRKPAPKRRKRKAKSAAKGA